MNYTTTDCNEAITKKVVLNIIIINKWNETYYIIQTFANRKYFNYT